MAPPAQVAEGDQHRDLVKLRRRELSEGQPAREDIARVLQVSTRKIERAKKRLVEADFEAALGSRQGQRREYRRKTVGDFEARRMALMKRAFAARSRARMATKLHALLLKFWYDKPEWRTLDLARAPDVSPSILSRSLSSMVNLGLICFDGETVIYNLYPRTWADNAGQHCHQSARQVLPHTFPGMHALMRQTRLGTNLGFPGDDSVMYLMHIDGSKIKPQRHAQRSACAVALHSPRKVSLAGLSDDAIRSYAAERPHHPTHTWSRFRQLRRDAGSHRQARS